MATTESKQHWSGLWVIAFAMIVGILVAKISGVVPALDIFDVLERKMVDFRFHWRQPLPTDSIPVVIVAADDNTELATDMRFPYSRSVWAHVVNNLKAAGAKVIVFDVQFATPADSAGDALLANAISNAGNVLLGGEVVVQQHQNLADPIVLEAPPAEIFTASGAPWAMVNMQEDIDNVQRDYFTVYAANDKYYLSLGVKALFMYRGITVDTSQIRHTGEHVKIGPLDIHTNGTQVFTVNYFGPIKTFPTYSVSQVLDDATFDLKAGEDSDYMELFLSPPPPGLDSLLDKIASENPFKDKIVLIGNTMPAFHDYKATPFDGYRQGQPLMYGVEVHANAIGTMYTGNYLEWLSFWWQVIVWLLFSFIVWWVTEHRNIWVGAITLLVVLSIGSAFNVLLFVKFRYIAESIAPLTTVSFAFVMTVLRRILREQREKTKIKGMFGQYVPKKVVGELIANPEMLRLGGEKRHLSVLFTDVAGFTTISEHLSPEELVHLLNEYLTAMTREILAVDGIIDKYEGDLIMAEFGAPVHYTDHAVRAVRASLNMQKKLAILRQKWEAEKQPILYSRVGINTGDMIVGNMGSEDVFDYTVMGDAVNLASRLEGVNKLYGTTIMCSQATYDECKDQFQFRFLDKVRVKGKSQFVGIYEVLGEKDEELPEGKRKAIDSFNLGRQAYEERDFNTAIKHFEQAMKDDPEDGPSATFYYRSLELQVNVPANWDGVHTLTEK
ncbi:MAG: adenylate/guanylate cyclase domain-containing protein [bacterium]|nr:adenylate/guanylate cyclase domain-containing protein [bacterium]